MSKETFRNALFNWLENLAKSASSASFRYSERSVWVKESNGAHRGETLLIPHWSEKHLEDLRETTEWQRVLDESRTWPDLVNHVDNNCGCAVRLGAIYADLGLLLGAFLPHLSFDKEAGQVKIAFSKEWFDGMFAVFAAFIESAEMHFRYTTVIAGLAVPDDTLPFALSDDVVLEKLSPEMIEVFGSSGMIRGHVAMGRPGPYENPQSPWLSLRWSSAFPKIARGFEMASLFATQNADRERTESIRDAFLGALALTRFGVAFLGSTASLQEGWSIGGFSFSITTHTPDMSAMQNAVSLDASDLLTVKSLFNALRNRKQRDDKIATATRRLVFAMEDVRDEDRLLDGMIAAEALLGTSSEIRYQFALRCAFLLHPNDEHARRAVFENMLHAYDVRSKLVHGSSPDPSNLKIDGVKVILSEFVNGIEDIVRQAVRKVVLSGHLPDWKDLIVGKKPQKSTIEP